MSKSKSPAMIKLATKLIDELPPEVVKGLLLNSVVGLSMISNEEIGKPPKSSPPMVIISMLEANSDSYDEATSDAIDRAVSANLIEAVTMLVNRKKPEAPKAS